MKLPAALAAALLAAPPVFAAGVPTFKPQEIDSGLKIGYAVLTADVDGDKKPDIVVVDQHKLVWYQNPGTRDGVWKKRVMLDGKTKPDNVCAAALDVDGDGLPEFVLGSAWKPSDTATAAQLGWVRRGKTLDDEWAYHPLPCDEPTVHRVRVFDVDGDGKPEVVHVPLQGRGATAKGNWTDGRPVRIVALAVPAKDPEKAENWKVRVLSEELHVTHNFWPYTPPGAARPMSILVASYEGYAAVMLDPKGGPAETKVVHPGNQANPTGSRGASEIKSGHYLKPDPAGKDRSAGAFVATVEPWHGNEVVVYVAAALDRAPRRQVLDDHLRWGHAVWCADLDGDGADELIIGVRDDPNPKMGDTFKERRGVRVYRNTDGKGAKWERTIVEDGGVAVEDLCAADLDGDGKIDLVAVGRATGNCRIYWNQGK
jgi:hypothetical protein